MTPTQMLIAIVFLPLLGAAIPGLTVRRISDRAANLITCGLLTASAVLSGFLFREVALLHHPLRVVLADWIVSGGFAVDWALRADSLTAVMLIVVTWVSAVVHIYSVGYMSHDPHKPRFM